jgi:RNA polymerase sigma-70 factor (ECF subfamily)
VTAGDQQLVRDLSTGRAESAARALYRTYAGELFGFAVHRLGDRMLAEEVVQDVFTQLWRHAGRYDPEQGSVRTWLYGIARNAVVDAERRRARRPPPACHDEPERGVSDEPIERSVLRWQVQLAFDRLTPEHREAVRLAHVEGFKLREIAARTGLPVGTVKSRLFYAMENLRLALEELGVTK